MKNYDAIAKKVYEYENAQYRLETASTLGSLAGKKQQKEDAVTSIKEDSHIFSKHIETKIETDIKYRTDNRANTALKYLRENINSRLTVSLVLLADDNQNYAIDLCGINNEKAEDLELLANIMLDRSQQLLAEAAPGAKGNIQKNIHNLEETLSLIKHYSSTSLISSGAKESRLLEDGFKESKETQLFEAILANNSSKVQSLIADEPNILKATDMHGDTPLMMAVKLKRYDLGNNIISTIAQKLNTNTNLKSKVLAHKNKYGLNVLNIAGDTERKVYKQLKKYYLSDEQANETKATDHADEITAIKDGINEAFNDNDFQKLNGLIARATLIGEVKTILNSGVDTEGDKPLIHKIISMPAEIHGKKQKADKLKTFKMLLDAGADPDLRSGDGKSLFQTIIAATSEGKNNLQDTAIKMLEELTRRGIKAPDDEQIIEAACKTSSNAKLFVKTLYDNGFRTGESKDVKDTLNSARIDKSTIKKITTAVSSEVTPSLNDKITKTNIYRDNLVWDWLRENRPVHEMKTRFGTAGSSQAVLNSKAGLKDIDRSRIKKDISFSLTQADKWEDNLKALETLHNAVMVLCEIDPIFKKVYALHEKKHINNYYNKNNIDKLKTYVISQLDGKIQIENSKSPSIHKEGQQAKQTLAALLTAQKQAVTESVFPNNKPKKEIEPPPYAKIRGVTKEGYNAHINRYRTDNHDDYKSYYHRDNAGPVEAEVVINLTPNIHEEHVTTTPVSITVEEVEAKVVSTDYDASLASFKEALNGDSAADLKTQIEAVNESNLPATEKHIIFKTPRELDGKTAYHLVADYYFHGDKRYNKEDHTQLLSKLSTDNKSIKKITDNQGLSMTNYLDIALISIYNDDKTELEELLKSIQSEVNYEAILGYKVDGMTILSIFEGVGLEPIAAATVVDSSVASSKQPEVVKPEVVKPPVSSTKTVEQPAVKTTGTPVRPPPPPRTPASLKTRLDPMLKKFGQVVSNQALEALNDQGKSALSKVINKISAGGTEHNKIAEEINGIINKKDNLNEGARIVGSIIIPAPPATKPPPPPIPAKTNNASINQPKVVEPPVSSTKTGEKHEVATTVITAKPPPSPGRSGLFTDILVRKSDNRKKYDRIFGPYMEDMKNKFGDQDPDDYADSDKDLYLLNYAIDEFAKNPDDINQDDLFYCIDHLFDTIEIAYDDFTDDDFTDDQKDNIKSDADIIKKLCDNVMKLQIIKDNPEKTKIVNEAKDMIEKYIKNIEDAIDKKIDNNPPGSSK